VTELKYGHPIFTIVVTNATTFRFVVSIEVIEVFMMCEACSKQISESGKNACSGRSIGYDIMGVVEQLDSVKSSSGTATTVKNLSRALILHPIAAGVAFLSFLTALASHRIGFLFASLIAMVATAITFIVMIIDWVAFGTVHRHVNGSDGPGRGANYSSAIWLVTASFIVLILGSLTVCCGCITDRRRRGHNTGRRY